MLGSIPLSVQCVGLVLSRLAASDDSIYNGKSWMASHAKSVLIQLPFFFIERLSPRGNILHWLRYRSSTVAVDENPTRQLTGSHTGHAIGHARRHGMFKSLHSRHKHPQSTRSRSHSR